jgi:hypothetical protein
MTVSSASTTGAAWTGPALPLADVWFGRLFDDAALFPPRRASGLEAVTDHRQWQASTHANLVGPFVCSDVQWPPVHDLLDADDSFTLSIAVSRGMASFTTLAEGLADAPVSLVQVEVPVVTLDEVRDVLAAWKAIQHRGVHLYVEIPIALVTPEVCETVAAAGARVKLRTGGIDVDAFPSELELARALSVCAQTGVPFKLTAGLHHAIRHRDMKTGFEHHGFLNVLLATSAALRRSDVSGVATMLALEHPSTVIASLLPIEAELAHEVRDTFTSFGTCSIDEPIDDLIGLGLITRSL